MKSRVRISSAAGSLAIVATLGLASSSLGVTSSDPSEASVTSSDPSEAATEAPTVQEPLAAPVPAANSFAPSFACSEILGLGREPAERRLREAGYTTIDWRASSGNRVIDPIPDDAVVVDLKATDADAVIVHLVPEGDEWATEVAAAAADDCQGAGQ